ncbi:hypothetical protein ACF0H5_023931 [Mactra antiquata]
MRRNNIEDSKFDVNVCGCRSLLYEIPGLTNLKFFVRSRIFSTPIPSSSNEFLTGQPETCQIQGTAVWKMLSVNENLLDMIEVVAVSSLARICISIQRYGQTNLLKWQQ